MGYESPFAAQRRLADAFVTRSDCFGHELMPPAPTVSDVEVPIAVSLEGELDRLAGDILETPGAGAALLAAFAAQSRALSLVAEASARAPHAPLPREVIARVRQALDQAPLATAFALS